MKKRVIFLAAVFVFAAGSQAQTPPDIRFGLKAGLNLSYVASKNNISGINNEVASVAGFTGGVFSTFRIVKHFSFQPELLYAQKNWRITDPAYIQKDSIGYLEMPLLAKWNWKEAGLGRFSILFGPSIALKLYADEKFVISGQEFDSRDPDYKNLDYGIVLGFEMPFGHYLVDVRYDYGLADILTTGGTTTNRTLNLMIGYRL